MISSSYGVGRRGSSAENPAKKSKNSREKIQNRRKTAMFPPKFDGVSIAPGARARELARRARFLRYPVVSPAQRTGRMPS
jgi:hypothetical protein